MHIYTVRCYMLQVNTIKHLRGITAPLCSFSNHLQGTETLYEQHLRDLPQCYPIGIRHFIASWVASSRMVHRDDSANKFKVFWTGDLV